MMKTFRHIRRGFTLIEMIVVIAIVAILAAAVTPIAVAWIGAYNANRDSAAMLDKLNYAIVRMARELREASSIPPSSTSPGKTSLNMSSTAPSFKRTEYQAGVAVTRQVTIAQGSGAVTLSYDAPSVTPAPVLTDQLSSLVFTYYDKSRTSTTSATNTCYVGIALTLSLGSQIYSQNIRVRLRNQNDGCSFG